MTQFARPDSDIAVNGSWIRHDGSALFGVGWAQIDEDPASDTDYVQSPSNPTTSDYFEVGLSNVTDPEASVNHYLRFRDRKAGGKTARCDLHLYQGSTGIFVSAWANASTAWITLGSAQLSQPITDSITDYTNLRYRFVPSVAVVSASPVAAGASRDAVSDCSAASTFAA